MMSWATKKNSMMRYLLTLTAFLFISYNSFAQQPCGTTEYEAYLNTKFPGFKEALDRTRIESINSSQRLRKASSSDTVYRIPVVFHIVWNKDEQNIHDSLVISQIKALNEAFRHLHKDTNRVRSVFKPVAGDTRIEFFLATKDPDGKPTNGINRVKTNRTDFVDFQGFAEDVKTSARQGADAWDPNKYLNIWVCKFTFNGMLSTIAYAFPPTNAKFWNSSIFKSIDFQGVVVNYQFVGVNNPLDQLASSLHERTIVHEVGHFLGLRHVWADKRNTCSGEDDGIFDTPNCNSATTSCSSSKNTCNDGLGDKPDMIENYMDYSPYPCTVMFTKQQADLMRFNLINLRPSLYIIKTPPVVLPRNERISVFPNPAMEQFVVNFEKDGAYEVTLTNMIGQLVLSEKRAISQNYSQSFSTFSVSSGIYELTVIQDNAVVHKQRLIVK
jgi:hypothetical protein